MWRPDASVRWVVDTCGCGREQGSRAGEPALLVSIPPARCALHTSHRLLLPSPVSVHDGEAHVNFEVSKSDLHDQPFRCKNGKVIDNRGQLRVIDDSIRYALADKNVEIAGAQHLRLRIARRHLPLQRTTLPPQIVRALCRNTSPDATTYPPVSANMARHVAENWEGLRRIVETTPPSARRSVANCWHSSAKSRIRVVRLRCKRP